MIGRYVGAVIIAGFGLLGFGTAGAEPVQLGTFGHWDLLRDLNPGPKMPPYCGILDSSMTSSTNGKNREGVAIQDTNNHQFDLLLLVQLRVAPTKDIPGTIAFSDGTITNVTMNYADPTFDAFIPDKPTKLLILGHLVQSETLTITIPGYISTEFYLGDSLTAVKALGSCVNGLPS